MCAVGGEGRGATNRVQGPPLSAPKSHAGSGRRTKGSWSAQRHQPKEQASATDTRDLTYRPITWEYGWCHLSLSMVARRFTMAFAFALAPGNPSMENTRGVKV
jgi:hypothetical protein